MPELLRLERAGRVQVERVIVQGSALTDYNRNEVVQHHLEGDSEALWFVDDDTIPPPGTVEWLVDLVENGAADVAAGLYYSRSLPYNPIAYQRRPNGLYIALARFAPGEIVYVDSVGMGCTLIKREVFEEIQRQYSVYRRVETGTMLVVHNEDVRAPTLPSPASEGGMGVVMGPGGRGYHVEAVVGPVDPVQEVGHWPFYRFEYGRTEDHPFCEMVKRCGFKVAVDTAIECEHVGTQARTGRDFEKVKGQVESYLALKQQMEEA